MSLQITGRQTQFYIDIVYGIAFSAGFIYLLFVGMDPRVAAFQGGLVLGYFLRVWENMTVYERILQEEVAEEAEEVVPEQVTAEIEEKVPEEVTSEVEQKVPEEVASEVEQKVPDEVSAEIEEQIPEEVTATDEGTLPDGWTGDIEDALAAHLDANVDEDELDEVLEGIRERVENGH